MVEPFYLFWALLIFLKHACAGDGAYIHTNNAQGILAYAWFKNQESTKSPYSTFTNSMFKHAGSGPPIYITTSHKSAHFFYVLKHEEKNVPLSMIS